MRCVVREEVSVEALIQNIGQEEDAPTMYAPMRPSMNKVG